MRVTWHSNKRHLSTEECLIFGRVETETIVGLDAADRAISRVHSRVHHDGIWIVENLSSSGQPLLLEQFYGAPRLVRRGVPCPIGDNVTRILIQGTNQTHVVTLTLEVDELRSTVTPVVEVPSVESTFLVGALFSDEDRRVLQVIAAPMMLPFPRRTNAPLTYAEAADRLFLLPNAVRGRMDRLKRRLEATANIVFEGPDALRELVVFALNRGVLTQER